MILIDGIEFSHFTDVVLNQEYHWTKDEFSGGWYKKEYSDGKVSFMTHDKMCGMIKYYWYKRGYRLISSNGTINLIKVKHTEPYDVIISRGV